MVDRPSSATLRSSPLWSHICVLFLRQNMRLNCEHGTQGFASWLLDIGHGRHILDDHTQEIPPNLRVQDLESLINFIYDSREITTFPTRDSDYFRRRIILSARNQDVQDINNTVLSRMPGEAQVYLSADSVLLEPGADIEATQSYSRARRRRSQLTQLQRAHTHHWHQDEPESGSDSDSDADDTPLFERYGERYEHVNINDASSRPGQHATDHATSYPIEFLRSLNPSGLPPGELRIKVGCPLILLRNLSPARGLCNGTRMVVTRMSDRILEARIVGGDHNGEIALIPRIPLIPSNNGELAFRMRRRQFPVRLAFAMTINKSQGQSVDFVGLDLRSPVFTHGQLYVALSRATSQHQVKILLSEPTASSTSNIVYPEVLLD